MAREIKFRGRRKHGNEILIGDLNHVNGQTFIFPRTEDTLSNSPDWFEVDAETVGQFTGLRDKNGKQIYESDLIKTGTGKEMEIRWSERFASFTIEKDRWAFSHWFGEAFEANECEIIGNVFEK